MTKGMVITEHGKINYVNMSIKSSGLLLTQSRGPLLSASSRSPGRKTLLTVRSPYPVAQSVICSISFVLFSSFQSLSPVRLFVTPWTAAQQASLSITNSWSLLKLMSIGLVMPSNHLIFCHLFFSCLQSFPASGYFQMSQFFTSGGLSIVVSTSASVFPRNTQD